MLDMNAGEFTAMLGVRRGEHRLGLDSHPMHDDPAAAGQRVEAALQNPGSARAAADENGIGSGQVAQRLRGRAADDVQRRHAQRPRIAADPFGACGSASTATARHVG